MGFCPLTLRVPADGHSSQLALIRQRGAGQGYWETLARSCGGAQFVVRVQPWVAC